MTPLSGLLKSLDKEGQESARSFYLQGYDGNQSWTSDRIGRGTYEAGVRNAMGSDVGTPLNYHGENALEVYWMHKAGLSVTDAIAAATGNAAKALGWDSWMGTLEAGKVADLIVHAKNPLEDLRALADKESLQFVMKNGEISACHAGNDLPGELFAKQVVMI